MNKKKKRKVAPPLSRLDKGIYIGLIIILFVFAAALAPDWSYWAERFFGDSAQPVALQAEVSEFVAVLLILAVLLICAFTLYIKGIVDRIPIFGNKTIEYGEHPWPKKLYPIFDKRRKLHPVNVEKKRFRRGYVAVICLMLVCAFLFSYPAICRRVSLEHDGTINAYNSLAGVSRYGPEDYDRVEFELCEHYHRFISCWTYKFTVVCRDGRSYSFAREDMKDPVEALETVLRIKSMLPEKNFMCFHYQFVETLISEENIYGVEEVLLRQVFEE